MWAPHSPQPHNILAAGLERHCALLHPTEQQQRLSQSFRTAAAVVSAAATTSASESAAADTWQREKLPKVQKVREVAAPRFES